LDEADVVAWELVVSGVGEVGFGAVHVAESGRPLTGADANVDQLCWPDVSRYIFLFYFSINQRTNRR